MSFTDTPTQEFKTLNISGDGAFFMTDQAKPEGTRVFMSLFVDASSDKLIKKKAVINLEGTVERRTTYGMAVCFDHRHQFVFL